MAHTNTYPTPYKKVIILTGLFMIITGLAVLFGWAYDIQELKSISAQFSSMKVNTAIGIIFLAASLLSLLLSHKNATFITLLAIAPVLFVGGVSFSENILHYNLNADDFFMPRYTTALPHFKFAETMSVVASFCFLMASLWIILVQFHNKRCIKAGQYILHTINLISGGVLFGYLYSEAYMQNFGLGTHMSLQTSVCFFVFSLAATLFHPKEGITGIFTGNKSGNIMARKIFIRMLVAIIVIGYCEILIHNSKVALPGLGSTLLTVLLILVAIVFVHEVSKQLNYVEEKKELAYQNLSLGIEAAPYALIITDNNGLIQHINNETERLYGYTKNELIGQSVKRLQQEGNDLFSQNDKNAILENGKFVRGGDNDSQYLQHKNGTIFPAELTFTPFRSMYGRSILISVIDLTDSKHREDIINRQIQELYQKNQELEQFSYIASHDLQEPLRTVSNYIALIDEDYPEEANADIKVHLAAMNSAVGRMSKLIRSLLDFGRLGRDRRLTAIDSQVVVNEVIHDLNGLITSSCSTIIIDSPLPTLYGYETELRQLFQNLINNAIKFRKKDTKPTVHIGCAKAGNFYEFYIKDNGIGIEPKYFESIFNIFQRVYHNDMYDGHGVGLANCKKIVEMHGGNIWVESLPGAGSIFLFKVLRLKKSAVSEKRHLATVE